MGDDLLAQDSQSEAALALRLAGKTPSRARDALWQRNVHQAPCHERLAHERNPLNKRDIRDDVAAVIGRTVPLHAAVVQEMLCGMGCHASCSEIHVARRRLRPDLFTKQKDRQVASAAAGGKMLRKFRTLQVNEAIYNRHEIKLSSVVISAPY